MINNKKIIIAGGTGFIGQEIIKYFGRDNSLIILTRVPGKEINNRYRYSELVEEDYRNTKLVKWDGKTLGEWVKEFEGSDMIINLTGKSVNCRYNKKNKREIFQSRNESTHIIGEAINLCKKSPALWINASSATIYRHATDRPQDEFTGEIGKGFSVEVCQQWEQRFHEAFTPYTRKVILRMAITLGPGGILMPYFNLLKFGLGGIQGKGTQIFSWIHSQDTCRMIDWIFTHNEISGVYNCCSPNPVTNREFMKALRKVTGYRMGLPAFSWMLKAGALLIGTEPELVLKSRWVLPAKISETGFKFKYPYVEEALSAIINKVPRKQYRLF